MPELPELEVLRENLISQIRGKKIKKIQILKPYILKNPFTPLENRAPCIDMKKNISSLPKHVRKTFINKSMVTSNFPSDFLTGFDEGLKGETVEGIERRGKFLIIKLNRYKIIIHLMLRGFIKYVLPAVKIKKSIGALIRFKDGTMLEINEFGHKKRMSMYIIPKHESLTKIEKLGLEPLENDFTAENLKNLLKSESKQLKSFLCNQKKIVGIGNAYADEILWHAQISPFKITTKLDNKEIKTLHKAIIQVLEWAIEKVREKGALEKREFLNIHNNKNTPCPRCGERILSIRFSNKETFYCPKCQTKGKKLKDRRMSKFYR